MQTQEEINQIRKCGFQNKPYRADVEMTVADIAFAGEGLTQVLSAAATGSDKMTDISYRVVDWKDDAGSTLVIQVTGRVEDVVAELNAAQQEG